MYKAVWEGVPVAVKIMVIPAGGGGGFILLLFLTLWPLILTSCHASVLHI